MESREDVTALLESLLEFIGMDRSGIHDPLQSERNSRLDGEDVRRLLREVLVELIGMEVDTP